AAGLLLVPVMAGTVPAQNADTRPRAAIAAWDTGQPSANPLAPAALAAKTGWTQLPVGKTASFQGDAVITNGRILVMARKQSSALEVSTVGTDGAGSPARLILLRAAGH